MRPSEEERGVYYEQGWHYRKKSWGGKGEKRERPGLRKVAVYNRADFLGCHQGGSLSGPATVGGGAGGGESRS